jgi:hypothetical protein
MCRLKELASLTVRSSERSIAKHAGAPSDATAKTHATRGSEKTTPPSACAASRNAHHHPRAANAPSAHANAYVKRFADNASPCLPCFNSVIAAAAARSDAAGSDVERLYRLQRCVFVVRVYVHGLAPRHVARLGAVVRRRDCREPREEKREERRGDPERESPDARGVSRLAFEGRHDVFLLVDV